MKAVTFDQPSPGADRTAIAERAEPVLGPGQVLVDVEFAGLNYVDVMARRGDPGYASGWPYVPGFEVSGTVLAVDAPQSGLRVGDRVAALTTGGGLAEKVVARADLTVPLPATVDGAVAAAAPMLLSTAMLLLTDATPFRPGATVLMHSVAGGVGGAVARLVDTLGGGIRVGTVSAPDKVPPACEAGWDHVLVRDDELDARIRDIAPRGADIVLDPLGTRMLDFDLRHAAPGAHIVVFGNPGGDDLATLPPIRRLVGGNVSIGGFSISRLSQTAPDRVARALRAVLNLVGDGKIDLPVTLVSGLDRVPRTHDALATGRSIGKYVVRVA